MCVELECQSQTTQSSQSNMSQTTQYQFLIKLIISENMIF